MIGHRIDQNDWEEHRRLTFALSIHLDGPQILSSKYRSLKHAADELWDIVMAPPYGRVIALSLLVLIILLSADIWLTQLAASAPPAQYPPSQADHESTIRAAAVHPALNASMNSAASPF
jgi:hypothetical protein